MNFFEFLFQPSNLPLLLQLQFHFMSDSYSDYSDSYTEDAESKSSNLSRSSKQKQTPAFTFADIPAEISLSLGEYCTVILKPGKKQYVVEVATKYPREAANKVQLTFGRHGCSVTQTENSIRSAISQPIPVELPLSNIDQHSNPQEPISLSTSTLPAPTQAHGETVAPEGIRLNPRDFYRRLRD
ncbi:Hypothetical protein GLP15_3925 [Giardia lamblia P15]|uniref:Uncharacterized protein n=1 Tax=Giardia intestinalis (strain P15) TaxID=658858 RepID=E1F2F6_GIAIA|nr:Hypothetical protein GLP15_3925 [Giardia lamblia P15]